MLGQTIYVFQFTADGSTIRIPLKKWDRIYRGNTLMKEYCSQLIHIAYAYISLKDRKPEYCPRIDGVIYYFDENGRIISDKPHYFDLLQDLNELNGDVIDLQHRKNKIETATKYQWRLSARQIQLVIDCIWRGK